jgi:hypothetical protein
MSKLIRNTTTALIELTDLQGCVIEAGETLDLASFDDVIVRTSVSSIMMEQKIFLQTMQSR